MRLRRKRSRASREPPAWDGLLPAFIDGKAMLVPPEVLEPYYRQVMARHDGGDQRERYAASQFGSNWRQHQDSRLQVRTDPTFTEWREIAREGDMAKLTTKGRDKLAKSQFALQGRGKGPEGKGAGSYPIPNASHARNALARVSQHGSSSEKATVKRAIEKKFPGIAVGGKKSGKEARR